MVFILDTCTINNLLQVDLISTEEDYELEYDYLSKINQNFKIKLPKKNYDELKNTFEKNLSDGNQIKFIRNYISKNIFTYLSPLNNDDFDSSLSFIRRACPKYKDKDNGELHSTAFALYLNRYENSLAFHTYFVTDDDEAILDFQNFFKNNFLGEILTTIDLLLVLSVYEIISYKNVIDFAENLKKQYMKNHNNLLTNIQKLQESKLPPKESSFLTNLYENINSLNFEKLQQDITRPQYANIKRREKNIDILLQEILKDDSNKVSIINSKINEIKSQHWTMDKII